MDFSDVEGGVCGFSQTTPGLFKQKLEIMKELNPEQILKYKFVSVGFPTKLLVRKRGVLVEYQTLKQREQYDYIYNKLNNYQFLSFNSAYVLFEQTKIGNLHIHLVVNALESDHDLKAEFYDCFDIKKGKNVRHFIDVQDIRDPSGLIEYLFNKDVKSYETVNQSIFKPLRSTQNVISKIEIVQDTISNSSLSIEF